MKKLFAFLAASLISLSMFATASVDKQLAVTTTQAATATRHNAPAAVGDTIILTFNNYYKPTFSYYAADGDWYIGWVDVSNTYIIRLDYVVGEAGKYGHYTIDNLDLDYSYLSDYSSGSRLDQMYVDADFTIADEGLGEYSLTGSITCENGTTYILNGYYAVAKDSVFTSNAKILAGTNSYLTDKINIGDTQYNAYKIGKSSAGGDLKIVLPKGATKLSFHALPWNLSDSTVLEVAGLVLPLYPAGISGNSPYTYAGRDASAHYYEIAFDELEEADTLTVSAAARVVLYGVNVVAPYSGVYAFEAKADSYDLGFGTLVATDNKSKHSVDANTAYFGDENGYVKFTNRLKVGAKGSADNLLTLNPTSKGTVKIYARTGSNSATDRNVVVMHGNDTLLNHVVLESEVVEHRVYADHKNQTLKVYPALQFEVAAGESYEITYPTGSINFYGLSINYDEPMAYVDTVIAYTAAELLANAPAVQTLIQVSGVVTKIEPLSYAVQDKTGANIWVAAAAGDSAEAATVEFYQCLALGGEGFTAFSALNDTVWMGGEYIAVGDTVKADGFYAPYKTQAEIAANTDKTCYPEILAVKHFVAPVPEPTTYFFKHPWNGGDWTWKEAADTTYLGIEASYVVAQWGDHGFNLHTEAADAGAQWYEKEIIGTATPDGNVGIGYPAVGTEVTFICLHDDYEHVVGGGRAWIVYTPATAIENTAAGVKAQKLIENGQIVIIKNGVRYNAVGAKL